MQTGPIDTASATGYLVNVTRIVESARKHGIADEDIWHAIRNVVQFEQNDEFLMLKGPGRNGLMLEIGIVKRDKRNEPTVIHAMPARHNLRRGGKR
jgi:hypothetical protein